MEGCISVCASEVLGFGWHVCEGFEGLCRCFSGYLWLKLDGRVGFSEKITMKT